MTLARSEPRPVARGLACRRRLLPQVRSHQLGVLANRVGWGSHRHRRRRHLGRIPTADSDTATSDIADTLSHGRGGGLEEYGRRRGDAAGVDEGRGDLVRADDAGALDVEEREEQLQRAHLTGEQASKQKQESGQE